MDKVWIANILLTRRCNLSCSYCAIVRNYEGKPSEYPDMKYYSDNELKPDQWIEIISRLVKNNPDVFFIFYGGEPFVYLGINEILKFCNDNDVHYTVITNNTPIALKRIYKFYEQHGKIQGLTSSVDPIAFIKERNDDIAKKSRYGLENLAKLKRDGIADDVVAEITVTKESLKYLYDMVEELSAQNIYSSITAVDDQKSPYYDFSNVTSEVLLPQSAEIEKMFSKIIHDSENGKLLVHIPNLLEKLYSYLPSTMKCTLNKDIHNVSIDPDGSFRLCLRVRGVDAPSFKNLNDIIDDDGVFTLKFKNALESDYNNHCKGCNWTCPIMSSDFSRQIIDHDGETHFNNENKV